jgi:threonyl-tRNA synthetase
MNCPGHVQIFKPVSMSYRRSAPCAIAEFGAVHRYEPSGALHGLMRVRGFTHDDAHIFCTRGASEECLQDQRPDPVVYADFGFEEIVVSSRPAREARRRRTRLGHARWPRVLERSARSAGRSRPGSTGRGAFYGPEVRVRAADASAATGRRHHQVDFNLPSGFGAFYIAPDGREATPVMLHRAMLGSWSASSASSIENYAGHFPLARAAAGRGLHDHLRRGRLRRRGRRGGAPGGLRVETDLRNEKITYKVREHSLSKVPALLVVGRKEAAERTVSIRRLGSPEQRSMSLEAALRALARRGGAARPAPGHRSGDRGIEPEPDLTLDGRHVVERTVA